MFPTSLVDHAASALLPPHASACGDAVDSSQRSSSISPHPSSLPLSSPLPSSPRPSPALSSPPLSLDLQMHLRPSQLRALLGHGTAASRAPGQGRGQGQGVRGHSNEASPAGSMPPPAKRRREERSTHTLSHLDDNNYTADAQAYDDALPETCLALDVEMPPSGTSVCGVCSVWPLYEMPASPQSRHRRRTAEEAAQLQDKPASLLHPTTLAAAMLEAAEMSTSNGGLPVRRPSGELMPLPAGQWTDSQTTVATQDNTQHGGDMLMMASQRSSGFGIGPAAEVARRGESGDGPQSKAKHPTYVISPPGLSTAAAIREAFGAEYIAVHRQHIPVNPQPGCYGTWKESVLLPPHIINAVNSSDQAVIREHIGKSLSASLFDTDASSQFLLRSTRPTGDAEGPVPEAIDTSKITDSSETSASRSQITSPQARSTFASAVSPSAVGLLMHVGRVARAGEDDAGSANITTPLKQGNKGRANTASGQREGASTGAGVQSSGDRTGGNTSPDLLLALSSAWASQQQVESSPQAGQSSPLATATPSAALLLASTAKTMRANRDARATGQTGVSPDSASAAAALDAFHHAGRHINGAPADFTFSPPRQHPSPKRPKPSTPARNGYPATNRKLQLNDPALIEPPVEVSTEHRIVPPVVFDRVSDTLGPGGDFVAANHGLLLLGSSASSNPDGLHAAAKQLCTRTYTAGSKRLRSAVSAPEPEPNGPLQEDEQQSKVFKARFPQLVRRRRSGRGYGTTGYAHIIAQHAAAAASGPRPKHQSNLRLLPHGLCTLPPASVLKPYRRQAPQLSTVGLTLTSAGSDLQVVTETPEHAAPRQRWLSFLLERFHDSDENGAQRHLQPVAPLRRDFRTAWDGRQIRVPYGDGGYVTRVVTSTLFACSTLLESATAADEALQKQVAMPSAARVSAAEAMVTLTSAVDALSSTDMPSSLQFPHEGFGNIAREPHWGAHSGAMLQGSPMRVFDHVHTLPGQLQQQTAGKLEDASDSEMLGTAKRTIDPLKAADDAPPSASHLDVVGTPLRGYALESVNSPSVQFPHTTFTVGGRKSSISSPTPIKKLDLVDEQHHDVDPLNALAVPRADSALATERSLSRSAFKSSPLRSASYGVGGIGASPVSLWLNKGMADHGLHHGNVAPLPLVRPPAGTAAQGAKISVPTLFPSVAQNQAGLPPAPKRIPISTLVTGGRLETAPEHATNKQMTPGDFFSTTYQDERGSTSK